MALPILTCSLPYSITDVNANMLCAVYSLSNHDCYVSQVTDTHL